jgi:hypothetical protein
MPYMQIIINALSLSKTWECLRGSGTCLAWVCECAYMEDIMDMHVSMHVCM